MSIAHWIVVVAVAVLLFGRHKVSDLMGDLAKGIRDFRRLSSLECDVRGPVMPRAAGIYDIIDPPA